MKKKKENDNIDKWRKKYISWAQRFSISNDNKKYHKVRDLCHYTGKCRGAAHDICNLRYKTPKEIPVISHNGSSYDYFIIKELANVFEEKFECLVENAEKYMTFSVPIKKKLDNDEIIACKIKFIVSFRFMLSSLSSLLDNLSHGLLNDKCKDCNFLDYTTIKIIKTFNKRFQ